MQQETFSLNLQRAPCSWVRSRFGSCSNHKQTTPEFFYNWTTSPKRSLVLLFGRHLCATAVVRSAQMSCTKRENWTNSIPTKQRRFGDTLKLSYSILYQTTSVTFCVYNIVFKWRSGCLKICTVCTIVLRPRRHEKDRVPGERSGRQQDAARGRLWWQAFHTTFEWWPFRSINTFAFRHGRTPRLYFVEALWDI